MRSTTILLSLIALVGCGDDPSSRALVPDPGRTPRRDVGFEPVHDASVLDAGFSDDASWSEDAGGPIGEADAGAQSDAGAVQDGGPVEDGGEVAQPDAGVVDPEPNVGALRLARRVLSCAGETISETRLDWNGDRLHRVTVTEFGEQSSAWTITWQDGRPARAEGVLFEGMRAQASWTYTGGLLSEASVTSPDLTTTWTFTYDGQGRLTESRYQEAFEGELSEFSSSTVYGVDGPTNLEGLPITYGGGRPSTVAGLPIEHQQGRLHRYAGRTVRYADGRVADLDDGEGCRLSYQHEPGPRAAHFTDSMPFGDLGALYGSDGSFHGRIDPGTWLFATIKLLTGD